MNYRDDCAGLCFLGGFSEEVSDQWIRLTEKNRLRKQRTGKGASTFMNCLGSIKEWIVRLLVDKLSLKNWLFPVRHRTANAKDHKSSSPPTLVPALSTLPGRSDRSIWGIMITPPTGTSGRRLAGCPHAGRRH